MVKKLKDIDLMLGCFMFGVVMLAMYEMHMQFSWYFGVLMAFFVILFCMS